MNKLEKAIISICLILTLFFNQTILADDYDFGGNDNSNRTSLYIGLAASLAVGVAAGMASFLHRGGNDQPIKPPALEVSNVHFTEPGPSGQQILRITNISPENVSINSFSFIGGANNNITIIEDNCSPAVGRATSCTITLEASEHAYDGQIVINHGYDNRSASGNITTQKAELKLYETTNEQEEPKEIPSSEEILLEKILNPSPKPQTFKWVNNGKFDWQEPNINVTYSDPNITLNTDDTEEDNGCNGSSVKSKNHCVFSIDLGETDINENIEFATTCNKSSITPSSYDKTGVIKDGIAIVKNNDNSEYHLGYRSLKILNTTKNQNINLDDVIIKIGITDVSTGGVKDKIRFCPYNASSSDCYPDYKTDNVCRAGQTLSASSSCKLWFKSENEGSTDLYHNRDNPSTISVQVNAGYKPWLKPRLTFCDEIEFDAYSDQALYAGGTFDNPWSRILKWDGSYWLPLNNGTNGTVHALKVKDNGDLYIGGDFTSPARYLVKWNGHDLLNVKNYELDGPVYAFANATISNNNYLFVGGEFNHRDNTSSSAKKILRCDKDDNCEKIYREDAFTNSDVVRALHFQSDSLYVGGLFSFPLNPDTKNVMRLNYPNIIWERLALYGTNDYVYALAYNNRYFRNHMYIAGNFTFPSCAFAAWDIVTKDWISIAGAFPSGSTIKALFTTKAGSSDDISYAGGDFIGVGYEAANYISKYEGGDWLRVGNNEINDWVHAITSLGDNKIYVGGYFTSPGYRLAMWNESTSNWHGMGTGDMDGSIRSLAITTSLRIDYKNTLPCSY